MSILFPAHGDDTGEMAQAVALQTLHTLAHLKNVPLEPGRGKQLAQCVATWLTPSELAQLDEGEVAGLAAVTRAANCLLDGIAWSHVLNHIRDGNGPPYQDAWLLAAFLEDITGVVRAEMTDKTLLRWPDIAELVDRYFATPRGPIISTYPNGDVVTSYWRGLKVHRDPAEGPALHCVGARGERTVYVVDGLTHRPVTDGPAILDRNIERAGHTVVEYWVNGQWHRPSSEGPAVIHTDATGKRVRELFVEHEKRHRDPAAGPAWWGLEDGCEKMEYMVDDNFHRDEADGPAVIARDVATGVILHEDYYRHGTLHRSHGPAFIARNTRGRVTLRYWCRDGVIGRDPTEGPSWFYYDEEENTIREEYTNDRGPHRDPFQGPAIIVRDLEGKVIEQEFWVNGIRLEDGFVESTHGG